MFKEKITLVFGSIVMLMIGSSVFPLILKERLPQNIPWDTVILVSAYAAILILLILVLILLQGPKYNNELIMLSYSNGKLNTLTRVKASFLVKMCRELYGMKFTAAHWSTYRCWLTARQHIHLYKWLLQRGDELFSDDEPHNQQYIAAVEFTNWNGMEFAHIDKLTDTPSEIDAAITTLFLQQNIHVFHSSYELARWYRHLPEDEQQKLAEPIFHFLKKGTEYIL